MSVLKECRNCKKQYNGTEHSVYCTDECRLEFHNIKKEDIKKDDRNSIAMAVMFISAILLIYSITSLYKDELNSGFEKSVLLFSAIGFVLSIVFRDAK